MACSVMFHRSCIRYLSPQRLSQKRVLSTTSTHPTGEVVHHHGSLSPLTLRGHSSVKPPLCLHHQNCYESHILCKHYLYKYDTNDMGRYDISHNLKTHAPALNNTKERNTYLDITSIMRIIGTLHIDLPKKFIWKWSDKGSNDDAKLKVTKDDLYVKDEKHKMESLDMQMSSEKQEEKREEEKPAAGAVSKSEDIKDRVSVKQMDDFKREQFSFSEAIEKQNSSIKNYYGNQADELNQEDTSVFQLEHKNTYLGVNPQIMNTPATVQSPNPAEMKSNIVRQITSFLPGFAPQKLSEVQAKQAEAKQAKKTVQKGSMPRSVVDRKTRGLVKALTVAKSTASKYVRLEELCHHLVAYPEAKTVAVRENVLPCLLRLRQSTDVPLREQAMEGLALVGYIDPVKGRGIRILSLDGGGTRGLVAVEILRKLEENCKKQIYELFDYICGVSTGSLIGIMLAEYKLPLDEVERLYKTFSSDMFNRYKLMGVGKLVMSHSYYDAQLWEKILKENIGLKTFLESVRNPKTPKISAISTLMNMTKLSNYVFRNYTHPPGTQTLYPGSCKYPFWQAVRASSAAPGYYEEYKIDEWIHQDGGLINNNPTGIAVHEARALWPNDRIQCVVSLGTGRYEPSLEPELKTSGLRNKVNKFIQSATDTEAVHTVLNDLLPPSTYYRFNPYMSEDFLLDEIRPDRWNQMQIDTQMYCRKNRYKIQKASEQLSLTKLPHQRATDWLKLKKTMLLS